MYYWCIKLFKKNRLKQNELENSIQIQEASRFDSDTEYFTQIIKLVITFQVTALRSIQKKHLIIFNFKLIHPSTVVCTELCLSIFCLYFLQFLWGLWVYVRGKQTTTRPKHSKRKWHRAGYWGHAGGGLFWKFCRGTIFALIDTACLIIVIMFFYWLVGLLCA